jgi:hypothetical protein
MEGEPVEFKCLEGKYVATFGKCIKFENRCIYLDDGTNIRINIDLVAPTGCNPIGKNIKIIADDTGGIILGNDDKILTYYGKRIDLTHWKGG